MTDTALRALEREWEASRSPETEAALLQAQVRAGVLLESRLQLAALLGHEAAVIAWGHGQAHVGPLLCDWAFEITEYGRETSMRAATAVLTHLLAHWNWPHPEAQPSAVLHAVEECLLCPCEAHEATCQRRADQLHESMVAHEGEPDLGFIIHQTDRSRPANAFCLAASLVSRAELDDDARRTAVRIVTDVEQVLGDEDDLRAAIRREVASWALGRQDVVMERVDARRGKESAHVTYFGQRMSKDWADTLERAQHERSYRRGDYSFSRIPYGSETFRDPREAASRPCHHCKTLMGKLHDPGCDYEQCPACGCQIMSCDCEFEDHEWREDA